jgi:surface polysaccharide O-acyltransferase-like enzyme
MTPNLKLFVLFSFIWSIPFFAFLNWTLENSNTRGPWMIAASTIFAVGFTLAGRQLGKRENKALRSPLALSYGLVAGVIPALVGCVWLLVWQPNNWLGMMLYFTGAIIVSLIIYCVLNKKTIKGITKRELFK